MTAAICRFVPTKPTAKLTTLAGTIASIRYHILTYLLVYLFVINLLDFLVQYFL